MKYALRTRFGKDIVAEFLPPAKRSDKVVIFCGGMPGMPRGTELARFFSRKGYWFFAPRYRGSWESGGKFLNISPEKDIAEVMDRLPRGFKDLYGGKVYKIKSPRIYLIGASFGGPAAILNSRDSRVRKVVCVSPVVDWRAPSKKESLGWLERFVGSAFGEAYRFSHKDWAKLKSGTFYNPIARMKEIDGKKIMIFHAKNDNVVGWKPVQRFSVASGAKLILLKNGGHLSSSAIMKPTFYKKIIRFFKDV